MATGDDLTINGSGNICHDSGSINHTVLELLQTRCGLRFFKITQEEYDLGADFG